jgi:protein-L-isoaspartate(D-aspartate) O-methyltransferase
LRLLDIRLTRLASVCVLAAACLVHPSANGEADPRALRERVQERHAMVASQIEARGVRNPRVLEAMREVPRHVFVPKRYRDEAYADRPLPIGSGQTISQPYIVAIMTELLDTEEGDRVLEVGTGSGYQAAVLSRLVARVFSIEIVPDLAERARRTLAAHGYENVLVITGDGYRGLPREAPFDGRRGRRDAQAVRGALRSHAGRGSGRGIVSRIRSSPSFSAPLHRRWRRCAHFEYHSGYAAFARLASGANRRGKGRRTSETDH